MTLYAAIRKAELAGASSVYRLSRPAIKRGIRTIFDEDDHIAIDWQVAGYPVNTKENYVTKAE